MVFLHDEILCSKKRDHVELYGESFQDNFKRSKQEDQTQTKLDKNITLFYQRPKSENSTLIKPDLLQPHLDAKDQSKSFEDHRTYLKEQVSGGPNMGLDLELNLSSTSSSNVRTIMKNDECSNDKTLIMTSSKNEMISGDIGLSRSPSWLAFECDDDDGDNQNKQEMVTTVCMKCHMLIMLCKSTLVCPNCKFTHPDDHNSTKQFMPLSLFKLLC